MFRVSKSARRNKKGVVAAAFFCLILLMVVVFGCAAIDIAHNVHVQTKLQAATDAGALAGIVEIAKNRPTDDDATRALKYARSITGKNEADNIYFKSENPGTDVKVYVDMDSSPRTVTVVASRRVNFLFSNLLEFGLGSVSGDGSSGWVSAKSVAAPFRIKSVYPHQIIGLILSLDHVPTKGPAAGQRISDILDSSRTIELVWNPQKSKNVGWVKDWLHDNPCPITIGDSFRMQNGVVSSSLSSINVGSVIGIPLTCGGVPMNDRRKIVGAITVKVLSKGHKSMTVKIHEPTLIHGVKGIPQLITSVENKTFLERWQPWTVRLIK